MKKNNKKHILKNIIPFNKFFFKSCYYHQLIAAYAHYDVEEDYITGNYLDLYDYNEDKELPINKVVQIKDDKEMEFISGIRLIKKKDSKDFFKEIINTINKNIPIMVSVDCFYLDYREDMYNKNHISHFILIYGYDLSKQQFLINEHYYFNSYIYSPRWIDFSMLKTAWENYVGQLATISGYSLIKIKKIKEKEILTKSRLDTIKESQNIINSYDSIIKIENLFSRLFQNKTLLENKLEGILNFIGIIRPKKVLQKNYFFERNLQLSEIADRILENYIFIYGILVRFKHSKIMNEQSLEKCSKRISEISELEKNLNMYYLGGDNEELY